MQWRGGEQNTAPRQARGLQPPRGTRTGAQALRRHAPRAPHTSACGASLARETRTPPSALSLHRRGADTLTKLILLPLLSPCLSILSRASDEMYTCSDESTWGASPPPGPAPPRPPGKRRFILCEKKKGIGFLPPCPLAAAPSAQPRACAVVGVRLVESLSRARACARARGCALPCVMSEKMNAGVFVFAVSLSLSIRLSLLTPHCSTTPPQPATRPARPPRRPRPPRRRRRRRAPGWPAPAPRTRRPHRRPPGPPRSRRGP
jgi:hypothetical protein